MSWIDGFCGTANTRPAYRPAVWGNRDSNYYERLDQVGHFKTARVQFFTNALNYLGYLFSPLIGIIRLIAALGYALSAAFYETGDDQHKMHAQHQAYKFAGHMAFRGLIELSYFGFVVGILGDCAYSGVDED